jgi:hypothetical protein
MCDEKVFLYPYDEVVLKNPLDELVKKVGREELVNAGAGKITSKKLDIQIRLDSHVKRNFRHLRRHPQ